MSATTTSMATTSRLPPSAYAISGAIAVEVSRLRAESKSRKRPTARDGLRAVLARPGNVKMRHGTLAVDVWER